MSKVSQHSFIHSLYKSRGVLLDILKRRGYNVEEYENISFSEISKSILLTNIMFIFSKCAIFCMRDFIAIYKVSDLLRASRTS